MPRVSLTNKLKALIIYFNFPITPKADFAECSTLWNLLRKMKLEPTTICCHSMPPQNHIDLSCLKQCLHMFLFLHNPAHIY
mmetsp:Transcript_21188/g.38366  ORF Transcript_21188/g.38366 Transcript_21188/m.38366 type:complete len:81 (-) Transcript_21188:1115-1357(-)